MMKRSFKCIRDVNKFLQDTELDKNRFLTNNLQVSIDNKLYSNLLIFDTPNSGKTEKFLEENLLRCYGSYVVLDETGELYHLCSEHFKCNVTIQATQILSSDRGS